MGEGFKRPENKEVDKSNIWADDAFEKLAKYENFLTNALTHDTNNFVLNVNGTWGCGKTFFVKRWAEELRKKNYPVVEFNAWENDSADDPLLSFVAECIRQLSGHLESELETTSLKECTGNLIREAPKLALEALSDRFIGERVTKKIEKKLSSASFVDEQMKKVETKKQFHSELTKLIKEFKDNEGKQNNVFIFIDELDRCRPTFAVELLERIKHLFNVDGIKFIVSTDTIQLSNSVKGLYGSEFDATTYLQRFFDQTFNLPRFSFRQFTEVLFNPDIPEKKWQGKYTLWQNPKTSFSELAQVYNLSLRQQQQVYHRVISVLSNLPDGVVHYVHIVNLCIMRLIAPKEYEMFKQTKGKIRDWGKDFVTYSQVSNNSRTIAKRYLEIIDMDAHARDNIFKARNNFTDPAFDRVMRLVDEHACRDYQYICNIVQLVDIASSID